MDLWLDLLFGNPVGLMSIIGILITLIIICYCAGFLVYKATHSEEGK
ncbi:DUF3149 domain-containing protein [Gallaecimonas sp. GXIMD4217]